VLSAKLRRVARRMKRIGEQQEAIGDLGLFCDKHAGLPSTVGVPPEKEAAGNQPSHRGHGVNQACAVTGGIARTRWAEAPGLAKRQIATQDGVPSFGEGACQRSQQRELGTGAGSMSACQAMSVGLVWNVEKASDGRIGGRIVEMVDLRIGGHVPQALKRRRFVSLLPG